MKNVSLYIARRYNSHTLIISMVLIILTAFLVGTFIYIGNVSTEIFKNLIYGKQTPLTTGNLVLLYSLTTLYILLQTSIIYIIFNKFLKRISKNVKLIVAVVVALISISGAFFITYSNTSGNNILSFISLILISTGLLSLIFALLSFVFAKRKITGVNIITSIAVFAITIATCSLFIILSVFSGLEKMNIQMGNAHPDIKISPSKGKTIENLEEINQKLKSNQQVLAYSKVIEEKVSIEYNDKQDIAYIKGIDENYTNVVRIDTTLFAGNFLDFETPNQILASDGVARRLQLYVDNQYNTRLSMPKPGTGLISSAEEAFNSEFANPIGVFFINEQYDKYIFSPIGLTQNLLELPENAAYSIEIKVKPNTSLNDFKNVLQKSLGNSIVVQTRQDLDATFLKVMNVENLIIYLIFTLVSIIASFNLAGAIIIIIIDKKKQIKSMWSFGMRKEQIKFIFFQTGLLITVFSILFGLTLGSIIGFLQNKFGLVMANPFVAFPFEFTIQNFLVVTLTVFVIGSGVSYLVSRKLPN